MKAVCSSVPRVTACCLLRRRLTVTAVGAALALGLMACSATESPSTSPTTTSPGETTPPPEATAQGTLATPDQATNSYTYNPELAPVGARMAIVLTSSSGSTEVTLDVSGLRPNRGYAVHLHADECGRTGDAAGPHFQHHVDPAATTEDPSTNPLYANPANEIWLDLRTDATGSATASTNVPFVLTDRQPESVVVHEQPTTATEPGKAGTAGGRVACLSIPDK